MPHASPTLRQLRVRAGIKPGPWAEKVQMHRAAYSLVENGHRSASPEFFARCATRLTEVLGVDVEPEHLIAKDPDSDDEDDEQGAGSGPPNRRDSTGPGRLQPGVRAAS